MPLFRSNSSGSASASRRSDLDRQIGCIAGFFQIFDPQVRAKQIAGPPHREVASQVEVIAAPPPAPSSAEFCTSLISIAQEAESDRGAECGEDTKVAKGDARASSELFSGDGEPQSSGSIQSTNASNHDSAWVNPSQQENLHRPPAKAAAHAREEPAKASPMVRHSSFKDRDYHDHEIAFSPQRGNVAAYVAGGRRFTSNGPINVCEPENRAALSVDERWGYWSSPAANWPSMDTMQEPEDNAAAGGGKNAWLSKGGRASERHWAAEDSLEEWKQSLRALARLKEDEETGVFQNNSGVIAPKASPRALRNELPPTSPARASAFDFKEAIRWSQRASSQAETAARRSWDDRDLPRSIAELRDAINARSRAISAASPPPSPRPPSVVARLMGLDNLPQEQQAPLVSTIERKPSGEAKLLQQLLQCSPSPAHPPLPPSSAVRAQHRRAGVKTVVEHPAIMPASPNTDGSSRSELQSMLKHIETMSQHGVSNTSSNAKPLGTLSRYSKPYENVEPRSIQSLPVKKSNHQNYLPVVILKQSEEIRSPSSRASHGYHDEIERRLRQLGLQSSEQERKTLKQILEAMQHKGLLKPPDATRSTNGTRRKHALSSRSPINSSGYASPAHTSSDGAVMWPSPPVTRLAHLNVSMARNAKRAESASIVIMRPLAKSMSRATANLETRPLVNERAHAASSSRVGKITPRKRKNAVKIESSTVKESGSSRSRLRSSSTSQLEPASLHTPVQTRKHSLKSREGQVHVAKASSRSAASSEQAQKSNDLSTLRQRNRESAALSSDRAKPSSVIEKEMESFTPDEVIYGNISDICVSDYMQNTSECHSDGSLGDPLSQETAMEDIMGIATPPREFKMDGNFGDLQGCFVKEVEQCSPVSVLDIAHLSNNELVESPDELEDDSGLRDYQVDVNICNPLLEEVRFPATKVRPAVLEVCSQKLVMGAVDEAHTCNVELADASEHNLLASPENAHTKFKREELLQHELDCDCSNNYVAAEGDQESSEASSASKEHMQGNDGGDFLCVNDTPVEDAFATDNSKTCARVMYTENGSNQPPYKSDLLSCTCISSDAINEDMLQESYGSNGEETDDTWTRNVDFCYAEDVLRGAGVAVGSGEGWCMAEGWLGGGGKMGQGVYEELEEQWDVLDEDDGCIEDRDMGGELYRKSQQAAMRRRLLFDCVDEILERRFSWVGIPGACGRHRPLTVATVCGDLQQLEEGPCYAEDSMYAILEQDLLHDADYSIPQCWNGLPTQLASVALHLEQDILDSLVLEVLPHALRSIGDFIV
ncbi:hypothetical protein GOP47_0028321 [Adiantum capillus-veneris]|nr:hypothetical protein GOP47_0028321 [Adiantum capillus-veneris]